MAMPLLVPFQRQGSEVNAELGSALLIVGNFLSKVGGHRAVCEDLAIRLREVGWTVYATSSRQRRLLKLVDMLASVWRLRYSYKVSQVDVFSGPAFLWALATTALLHLLGKPYIVTLHGGALPTFGGRWPGVVRCLLRSADAVTAPSGYLRREMRRFRDDILVLPNALDTADYPFRIRDNPEPRLVWLRAFHGIYNPALAPAVLAAVSRPYPAATLTMIGRDHGDGSLERVLEIAAAEGIADRLRVVPGLAKDRVAAALSAGDIFLNTSNIDNTPVSVLEAMACGLCVVSTNVGGLPDLIEHGVDGMLVPAADATAMADAVCAILSSKELAAQLSRQARAKALKHDWSVILPRWESLIRSTGR
jgi:glycosyltransferase involved in cell wall biosynthesis